MNRRGKRVTLGVMAVGVAVVLCLAIAHWGTVRDHIEAWHFQLTRETVTIERELGDPTEEVTYCTASFSSTHSSSPPAEMEWYQYCTHGLAHLLAKHCSLPVIYQSEENEEVVSNPTELAPTAEEVRRLLQTNGYRVLEQRFPRHAYVVIRDKEATR